jgi:hypothetical protein
MNTKPTHMEDGKLMGFDGFIESWITSHLKFSFFLHST